MSADTVTALQLLFAAVVAIGVIAAGFWALSLLVVKQFEKRLDERFQAQEAARKEGRRQLDERWLKLEGDHARHEREFLELKADLPIHYVRREDYVRNQSIIEAKLDGLALRIENTILKGGRDA